MNDEQMSKALAHAVRLAVSSSEDAAICCAPSEILAMTFKMPSFIFSIAPASWPIGSRRETLMPGSTW